MTTIKLFSALTTSSVLALGFVLPVAAQVIPDGTTSTTVEVDGTINDGDRAGGNLFHSFQEFSVPDGGRAFFNNALDIVNIFSRVTGGNISDINGLLGANGAANLFLINPAGIIFGPNARLSIGGSFFGSTADSIVFSDGEFSALDPDNPPLLTINAPLGLNFRDTPGEIATTSDPTGQSFANLTVNPGQSIHLVGGNINLDRSLVNAPGGTIELGGLAVSGEVGINDDGSLSFSEGLTRADISLNNGTTVNVVADNGGSIKVNANNLEILNGSTILAGIVPGSQIVQAQAGDITIHVTEKISLESNDPNNSSQIANNVGVGDVSPIGDVFTIGSAGNVTINTKILEGNGYFQIGSLTNGEGNAGDVTIKVTERLSLLGIEGAGSGIGSIVAPSAAGNGADITITTPTLVLSNSLLATSTTGQGNAGNIFINATDSIFLSNASQLQAASFGIGDAGNIAINAETADISLEGENVLVGTVIASSAGVFSDAVSTGQGGDIIIKGRNLSVTGGASLLTTTVGQATAERLANAGNIQIDVSENVTFTGGSQLLSQTLGQGNAGNVNITAGNEVSFDGENNQQVSGIFNTVEQLPELLANFSQQRRGGNINITARSFSLTNGAEISSSTSAEGDGGTISVTTNESISLDGITSDGTLVSGIFNTVNPGAIGNGGDIEVTTNNLEITNGAVINASSSGIGDGGTISVTANESVSLDGTSPDGTFASGIFNTVNPGAIGNGGDIEVTTNDLEITNGATINVSSFGEGNGGNITVTADSLNLDSGSIFAAIQPSTNEELSGGNITLQVENNLILRNNSTISAAATNNANGGNVTIGAGFVVGFPSTGTGSDIRANAELGRGGNINIQTQGVLGFEESQNTANLENNTNDIDASSLVEGLEGVVTINNPDVNPLQGADRLPTNPVSADTIATEACSPGGGGSSLTYKGKGGIPPEPTEPFSADALIPDGKPITGKPITLDKETDFTSLLVEETEQNQENLNYIPADIKPIKTDNGDIYPARGIIKTADGKIILTAYPTPNTTTTRTPEKKLLVCQGRNKE